jgi:diapolycopene oxygenase
MSDYFSIRALRPHWRNFFEDGKVVDLYPEPEKMAEEARKVGEPPENIERFLKYSADLYDLTNDGYFEQGFDNWQGFRNFTACSSFSSSTCSARCIKAWRRICKTRYFRDIFDFFIKYVGSSAYRAPAFMNAMPTIQFRYDLWYVDGGLYNIASP